MRRAGAYALVLALLFGLFAAFQPHKRTMIGLTLCLPGVGPITWVNPELPTPEYEATKAHEASHAADYLSSGCLPPLRRLEKEARALCAELPVLERHGWSREAAFERLTQSLTIYRAAQRIGADSSRALLERHCQP